MVSARLIYFSPGRVAERNQSSLIHKGPVWCELGQHELTLKANLLPMGHGVDAPTLNVRVAGSEKRNDESEVA